MMRRLASGVGAIVGFLLLAPSLAAAQPPTTIVLVGAIDDWAGFVRSATAELNLHGEPSTMTGHGHLSATDIFGNDFECTYRFDFGQAGGDGFIAFGSPIAGTGYLCGMFVSVSGDVSTGAFSWQMDQFDCGSGVATSLVAEHVPGSPAIGLRECGS